MPVHDETYLLNRVLHYWLFEFKKSAVYFDSCIDGCTTAGLPHQLCLYQVFPVLPYTYVKVRG